MKRPFLFVSLFFIAGIISGTFLKIDSLLVLYLLAAISLILFFVNKKAISSLGFYLLIVICGFAAAGHSQRYLYLSEEALKIIGTEKTAEFQGVVIERPVVTLADDGAGEKRYQCKLLIGSLSVNSSGSWAAIDGNAVVICRSDHEKPAAEKYDRIRFYGKAAAIDAGSLSNKSYFISNKIACRIYADEKKEIIREGKKEPPFLIKFIDLARGRVLAALSSGLPDNDIRKLLIGMILGEREGISEEVKDIFLKTNTIHILAISGQQVTLVSFIVLGVLGAFSIPKRSAALITIPFVALYALIVGNEPSVLRSAVMMLVILIGRIIRRDSDIINSLAFAALVMLAINPFDLYNVGFQLSYVVVLAIVVFTPAVESILRSVLGKLHLRKDGCEKVKDTIFDKLLSAISVCAAAWIGSAPLILYYFHIFSPVSILSNLFTAGLVGFIIVPLGFASIVFGQISLWISSAFNAANGMVVGALIWGNRVLSELPFAFFETGNVSLADTFLFYGAVLSFSSWNRMKKFNFTGKKIIYLLFVLCVFVWMKFFTAYKGTEVTFFDVGQGDAAFVKTSTGKSMLVDGGPAFPRAPLKNKLLPYLRANGIKKIDEIVITHPHADHIGGIQAVLDNVSVGELVTNGSTHPSFTYKKILETVEKLAIGYREVKAGDEITLDKDVRAEVIWPDESAKRRKNENDSSVVLMLNCLGTRILLCADIEKWAQEKLSSSSKNIGAHIVKMPHHGGASAYNEDFLRKVSPMIAVISVGRKNPFGHPSEVVINYLKANGVKVYRTDVNGTVTVRISEKGFEIKTKK